MIELKRRIGKDERYELDGNSISWVPIAAAAIGAIGSYLASKNSGGGGGGGGFEKTTQTTQSQDTTPKWAAQQVPYLFGGQAWNPYSVLPSFAPEALDYGQGLMQPGAESVLGLDSLLGQISGGGQDILGMLGIGQAAPPTLLTNSPLYQGDLPAVGGDIQQGMLGQPAPEAPQVQNPQIVPALSSRDRRFIESLRRQQRGSFGFDMIDGMA